MNKVYQMYRIPDLSAVKASRKPEDYYLIPDGISLGQSRRLIVIVPPGGFDDRELALKVARLEAHSRKSVLLVGLAQDPIRDSLLEQRMQALKSDLSSTRIETSCTLLFYRSWKDALQEILEDGDRVVCLEDHFTTGRLLRNVRLAHALVSSMAIPVYVIQGIRLHPEQQLRLNGFIELLVWLSILLTIALFLLFQVRIQQTVPGMMGAVLGISSVIVEFMVILGINSLGN